MQQDGRQVWPPSGSFSVSSGNEVPMNLKLPFVGSTRIALFDEEDIGSDDRLGSITIGQKRGGTPALPGHRGCGIALQADL